MAEGVEQREAVRLQLADFQMATVESVSTACTKALAALEERLHGFYAADDGDGDGGAFGASTDGPKAGTGARHSGLALWIPHAPFACEIATVCQWRVRLGALMESHLVG